MFLRCCLILFALSVDSKPSPSIDPPPLVLLNIVPDDFLKFFFSLSAAEKSLIEDEFLERAGNLSTDEKTKLFIDKLKEDDPQLSLKLEKVIEDIVNKTALLTKPARKLFDLFLVKPHVPRSTRYELKKLTQLRLQQYSGLSREDKKSLKKHFPGVFSFFESLIADKQTLNFADFSVART